MSDTYKPTGRYSFSRFAAYELILVQSTAASRRMAPRIPELELAVCLPHPAVFYPAPISSLQGSHANPFSEFAHGKVDPHEAGKQGGQSSGGGGSANAGGDNYKPTEHGGQTKDGQPDGRVKQ
ncbi:unnamed protein product [Sphagnum jensenii]